MIEKIKSTYIIFISVFLILFLTSSAFVNPMNWWSLHKITEITNNGFTASFSGIKILSYAVLSLIIALFIKQSSLKQTLKRMMQH